MPRGSDWKPPRPDKLPKFNVRLLSPDADGSEHFDCSGILDEGIGASLAPLQSVASQRCVLRMRDIEWVNSSGMRAWAVFIRAFQAQHDVYFAECSTAIMQQVNLISNFLPADKILSFVMPYACFACQTREETIADADKLRHQGVASLTPPRCPQCGAEMECEEALAEYLLFLKG